jgi:hypothetical protein
LSDIHSKDSSLFNIHDLLAWTPPPIHHILGSGVLDVGHRLQIFGDEGSWKSMLVMHMAYSLASGHRRLGFSSTPVNVIYVQGEMGMYSVQSRSLKYCSGTEKIYRVKNSKLPSLDSTACQNHSLPEECHYSCSILYAS